MAFGERELRERQDRKCGMYEARGCNFISSDSEVLSATLTIRLYFVSGLKDIVLHVIG